MSGAKHTPGPWAWHESENSLIGLAGVHIIKDWGSYEGLSINDWDRLTEDECTANKLLIAAAPDMLDALKAMDAALCEGFETQSGRMAGRKALIAARAAIAKAEGLP